MKCQVSKTAVIFDKQSYPITGLTPLLDLNWMSKLRSIDEIRSGNLHPIDRVGIGIGLQMADFLQRRKAGDHFTKDRVLAVLRRDGLQADIKLASVGLTSRVDFVW